jgi:putative flippase GtrA
VSVRFAIVGATCTVLDIGLFNILVFGEGVATTVAKVLSTAASVSVSYILNSTWTFHGAGPNRAGRWRFSLYALVNIASVGISVLCLRAARAADLKGYFWTNAAAFGVVLVLGAGLRFLVYRRWLFAAPSTLEEVVDSERSQK